MIKIRNYLFVLIFLCAPLVAYGETVETSSQVTTSNFFDTKLGLTIIAALVGGAFGFLVSILKDLINDSRLNKKIKVSTVCAIKSEIKTINDILGKAIELRDKGFGKNMQGGGWLLPHTYLQSEHFIAYKSMFNNFHLLPIELIQDLTEYYGFVISLEKHVEWMKGVDSEFYNFYYRDLIENSEEFHAKGTALIKKFNDI